MRLGSQKSSTTYGEILKESVADAESSLLEAGNVGDVNALVGW